MLALVQVPEHGDTILSARGSEGTIGRDGDGVDVASVSIVVGLQLELGEFPDLEEVVSEVYGKHERGSEILVEK